MFLIGRGYTLPRVAPRPESVDLVPCIARVENGNATQSRQGAVPCEVTGRLGLRREASCDDSGNIVRFRLNL